MEEKDTEQTKDTTAQTEQENLEIQAEPTVVEAEAQQEQTDPRDAQIEDLEKALLRVKADYDNFRRRTVEEKAALTAYVTADIIGKILPTLDTLGRAYESLAKFADEKTMSGIEMIIKQFEQTLTNIGVEKIEATVGTTFDPNVHEAVMSGSNPELPENSIELVFEEGYKYQDKVIRHSKVKVVNS